MYTQEQIAAFHGMTLEEYRTKQANGTMRAINALKVRAVRNALAGNGQRAQECVRAARVLERT